MNKINNTQNISFTSLKSQKRLGEEVLREFEAEMGYLKSSSNLGLRLRRGEAILNKPLLASLQEKQKKMYQEIYDPVVTAPINGKIFKTFHEFKEVLVENIKQKGNKANCWEDMMLVFIKLLEKGEKPRMFGVEVYNSGGRVFNHFSTVIGLKKGAKMSDPKTWGSKAVLVDTWVKTVKPAHEALKDITTILAVGKEIKLVKYSDVSSNFVLQH